MVTFLVVPNVMGCHTIDFFKKYSLKHTGTAATSLSTPTWPSCPPSVRRRPCCCFPPAVSIAHFHHTDFSIEEWRWHRKE